MRSAERFDTELRDSLLLFKPRVISYKGADWLSTLRQSQRLVQLSFYREIIMAASSEKRSKMEKVSKNNQKFSDKYTATWLCNVQSRKGVNYALCTVCRCDISVKHSGQYDVKTHIGSPKHRENLFMFE